MKSLVDSPSLSWADLIRKNTQANDVVLDAFAQDASVARAALDAGRRAVLLTRTPAMWLALWGALAPPEPTVVRRAMVWLSATKKRGVSLDRYLQSLYHTRCPSCNATIAARSFVWHRRRDEPVAKEVECSHCGFQGRASVDAEDAQRAAAFDRRGLHYWFILEWLADAQDVTGREWAQRLLDEYSPRNLSALADVTRKLDAELQEGGEIRRTLQYLLLQGMDAGRMRPDPAAVAGSKQWLIERNVWQVIEEAAAKLEATPPSRCAPNLDTFFQSPAEGEPSPNLVLAMGPVQRLAQQLPPGSIALLLGRAPSLNPDAWVRERLWSRWLFGRGSSAGLHPPLGGWARHVRALSASLKALAPALRSDGKVVFCFGDPDPARAYALLLAAAPHFTFETVMYQPTLEEPAGLFDAIGGKYQLQFRAGRAIARRDVPHRQRLVAEIARATRRVAHRVITYQGEPTTLSRVAVAVFGQLASAGVLERVMALPLPRRESPLEFIQQAVRSGMEAALNDGTLAGVGEAHPTHWWLPRPPPTVPLADRVEEIVAELLAKDRPLKVEEVYQRFSGIQLPEAELVQAALQAYGEEIEPGVWRAIEIPSNERNVLLELLEHLGRRLGFAVAGGLADLVWGEEGRARHAFRVLSSARLRGLPSLPDGVQGHLVVSERLVPLVTVKLARNPLLRLDLGEKGWGFIKAPHVESLAQNPEADRQEFKKILGLHPIIEQPEAQMPLF